MLWTRKNIVCVCVCQLQKWTINVMNWKKCFNVLTVSITHWAIEVACATKAANFVLPICIATIPHRTWRRGVHITKGMSAAIPVIELFSPLFFSPPLPETNPPPKFKTCWRPRWNSRTKMCEEVILSSGPDFAYIIQMNIEMGREQRGKKKMSLTHRMRTEFNQ